MEGEEVSSLKFVQVLKCFDVKEGISLCFVKVLNCIPAKHLSFQSSDLHKTTRLGSITVKGQLFVGAALLVICHFLLLWNQLCCLEVSDRSLTSPGAVFYNPLRAIGNTCC